MECSICLDVINGPTNMVVTNCGHSFHCLCLMTNIAHMTNNSFNCPNCRESLVPNSTPQLHIQFNLSPIASNDDDSDDYEDDDEEDEDLGTDYNAPERVRIIELNNVQRYLDENDYVYDMNSGECIGLMYDAESLNDVSEAVADIPPIPLTNFVIVDSFDNPPIQVVIEEIAGTDYYMNSDFRLYDLNTRNYVGMANLWTDSIDYNVGAPHMLQDFIVVDDFNNENDIAFMDDDDDDDDDDEEDEEEEIINEACDAKVYINEAQEAMCC